MEEALLDEAVATEAAAVVTLSERFRAVTRMLTEAPGVDAGDCDDVLGEYAEALEQHRGSVGSKLRPLLGDEPAEAARVARRAWRAYCRRYAAPVAALAASCYERRAPMAIAETLAAAVANASRVAEARGVLEAPDLLEAVLAVASAAVRAGQGQAAGDILAAEAAMASTNDIAASSGSASAPLPHAEVAAGLDAMIDAGIKNSLDAMIDAGMRSLEGSMRGGGAAGEALARSASAASLCSLSQLSMCGSEGDSLRGGSAALEALYTAAGV